MTRSSPITADALAGLVEARQPVIVWGPPGRAKSQTARQVAPAGRRPRSCPRATPGGGRIDIAA